MKIVFWQTRVSLLQRLQHPQGRSRRASSAQRLIPVPAKTRTKRRKQNYDGRAAAGGTTDRNAQSQSKANIPGSRKVVDEGTKTPTRHVQRQSGVKEATMADNQTSDAATRPPPSNDTVEPEGPATLARLAEGNPEWFKKVAQSDYWRTRMEAYPR